MFVSRSAETLLRKLAGKYPVLSLTGPRQSGKTTLVQRVFPDKKYVSLENPNQLAFATEDPLAFLENQKSLIIDEAQLAPQLFSYMQELSDASPRMGRFILTGSQNFLLLESISQSLAGRVALVKLLPFSQSEYMTRFSLRRLEAVLFKGMYPAIYARRLDAFDWYANYVATYVERDVRRIINIGSLSQFQKFIKMCAARSGQILNLSSLAHDCGITHNTAKSWLSVLESSFIVHLLPAFYENYNKRILKAPKLFFYDTGLLCYLLGIPNAASLKTHAYRGQIFETYVFSELAKLLLHRGQHFALYYWRDRRGNEIDFLLEYKGRALPVEVKSGKTINTDYFKNIYYWQKLTKTRKAFLVYAGDEIQKRSHALVLPWNRIHDLIL